MFWMESEILVIWSHSFLLLVQGLDWLSQNFCSIYYIGARMIAFLIISCSIYDLTFYRNKGTFLSQTKTHKTNNYIKSWFWKRKRIEAKFGNKCNQLVDLLSSHRNNQINCSTKSQISIKLLKIDIDIAH